MAGVKIAAVGDVSTGFEPPDSTFAGVMSALLDSDLRFAQNERLYSSRRSYPEHTGMRHRGQEPRMAEAFKSVPFEVVSAASNHTGDWGTEIIDDTLQTLRGLGVATVGAGRNLEEARRPAIIERNGMRIAFVGYASVVEFPDYWATDFSGGCAPMRAYTYYHPYETQPGAAVRVVTVPHPGDLEQLQNDVKAARQKADFVLLSIHWGVHFTTRPCDYQVIVGHAAIDAGACAVLGHHPHQLQAIEAYKGGMIFYSLGNFCFWRDSVRKSSPGLCSPESDYTQHDAYSLEPDPGAVFDYKRHFNEGGIALLTLEGTGVANVEFVPTLMDEGGKPAVVEPPHPQFGRTLEYLNWCGKFVDGGITTMAAAGNHYSVYARGA